MVPESAEAVEPDFSDDVSLFGVDSDGLDLPAEPDLRESVT